VNALDFLFSLERLGMKFGLENMKTICAALDHPEARFRSVIVAGTNGKGSVTAMTATALHAAGHRTARYTSPHLERLEERFVIDEREVTRADLEDAAQHVRQTVERLVERKALETLPTFFECTTAIAFELFARAAVEVAVVEVGLGGRLDATNVLTPMAAVITSIDFDHQDLLGGTLTSIAAEKAGVIKPGIPVIVGCVPADAAKVIEATCAAQSARYISAPDAVATSWKMSKGETIATFTTFTSGATKRDLVDVPLALRGEHQVANAAVAIRLIEELDRLGVRIDDAALRTGLTSTRWPGRLERLQWRGAEILLDAAHNPGGARALATYLREAGWPPVALVIGMMRDKDVTGILSALLPLADTLVCTTPSSPRALPAAELAARAAVLPFVPRHVSAIDDPADAMASVCRAGARVVAAGSIFLIGPLRGILR
jgi:dihydrofolate synthase / folylpolyglutamate synthase